MDTNNNKYSQLDKLIINSLLNKTSDKFSNNLISELELRNKFALEDKKTSRFVKTILLTFSVLFFFFSISLSMYITNTDNLFDNDSILYNFYNILIYFGEKSLLTFGFNNVIYSLALFIIIVLVIIMLIIIDKETYFSQNK